MRRAVTPAVGLIGCGGRGTGAAAQALRADPDVKLTAMADMFGDRLEMSLENLKKQEDVAGKIDVPAERQFTGLKGYQQLLAERRGRGAVGIAAALPSRPPEGGRRCGRPCLCREAGGGRRAGRAVGVGHLREGKTEEPGRRLRAVPAVLPRLPGDRAADPGRARSARSPRCTPTTTAAAIWLKPRQPDWTDMHYQMRELVLLHLAVRRLQRGAARAFPGRLRLDHGRPVSGQGRGHGRPPAAHRARVRQHLRSPCRRLRVRRRGPAGQQHAGR